MAFVDLSAQHDCTKLALTVRLPDKCLAAQIMPRSSHGGFLDQYSRIIDEELGNNTHNLQILEYAGLFAVYVNRHNVK